MSESTLARRLAAPGPPRADPAPAANVREAFRGVVAGRLRSNEQNPLLVREVRFLLLDRIVEGPIDVGALVAGAFRPDCGAVATL